MLNEKLDKYLKDDYYPFHMPGGKRTNILRNDLAYQRDLTEIDGFDNLNDPKDIFLEMQESIANIYRVKKAIISTNGSTCGILSSIRALSYDNKDILVERSCHKSVYNAIELNQLKSDYINVILDQVNAVKNIDMEDLEKKLSKKSYSAVVVNSPSYEGYYLDLERIHNLCKSYNTPLIVDMAHGAHLPLSNDYHNNFDIAITSFHKSLSALTPSAGVLINDMNYYEEIKRNMAIFQTSSPSYIILQSIDDMLCNFDTFPKLYKKLSENLSRVYEQSFNQLEIIDSPAKDKGKIIISCKNTNITGFDLQKMLKKEKIEIEMAYPSYGLLIATIFDRDEGFDRLIKALKKIDDNLVYANNFSDFSYQIPKKKFEISDTLGKSKKTIKLSESNNQICGQFVYAYPPGIPIIAPGELIDERIIENIYKLRSSNINLNIENDIIVLNWQEKIKLIIL